MVPVLSLWLPILVAAVLVFIVSSIIHMFLPYHWSDWSKVPEEDRLIDTLAGMNIEPGNYTVPHAASMAAMKEEAYVAKRARTAAIVTVVAPGQAGMGKQMGLWFLFSIVVGIFAAYVAGRALGPGADYTSVFRFAGTAAFLAYAVGGWQESIWFGRKWSTTLKSTIDGLVYGLLTAGAFGWLWPGM